MLYLIAGVATAGMIISVTGIYLTLKKEDNQRVVDNILRLWDDNNGWIPGCDYRRLAEAIGVPADRLKKEGNR